MDQTKLPPLVSAIVPTYNAERFLPNLIIDLEAQTIADKMEIIIVDTGSETKEIDIVREYQSRHSNIVYVRTSVRENATAATNRGIQLARGKYITPAPTDDRLRHDAFEIMVKELEEHQDVATVYADVYMTKFENQTFYSHVRCGYSIRPDFSPEMMLTGYHMGPLSMWRKSIHAQVGFFNENLLCASDYEFHCRVALRYPMRHIPKFLGLYLQNPKGTVCSNPAQSENEFNAIRQAYQDKFPPPSRHYPNILYYPPKEAIPGKYVNICMVTYNRLEFTKASIASILQFTCFPHVLTVVDNGSTDGTREYLKALKHEGVITNLVLLDKNVGIAKASNLAWSQDPDAEYYLKLDNDIVVQKPYWLMKMVEVIDGIQELGAIAYNFEQSTYELQTVHDIPVRIKEKGNLGGACILIPRRTQKLLGYWCEDYGLYGEEDADYGERICLAGLKNAYMEDEAIGLHLPAGRAAHIDATTLKATDGIEEHRYREYREFKDALRQKNIQDIFVKQLSEYKTGRRPLYYSSSFVKAFTGSSHAPSHSPRSPELGSGNRASQDQDEMGLSHQGCLFKFDCSIIIPVFNRCELTRQCLTHLSEVTRGCTYEVIIVDNASTDETKDFLTTLAGDIQIIRNTENLGFAKACNQGAASARGQFLVFLNNDTIPKEGWLIALLEEVRNHPEVVVVGSKLLYPDGTIQHAGVVFSRISPTPYHIYSSVPETLPAVNRRREFQVVTAACMLARRDEFNAVGGFDEGYKNGFEDVDLCLKIGQRGGKIVYQPKSVLYHLESQSPGRKDKRNEAENTMRLLAKWEKSILIDEDLISCSDGYAIRYYVEDEKPYYRIEAFKDQDEKVRWEQLAQVQRLLLESRNQEPSDGEQCGVSGELEKVLTAVHKWPEDVEVLRWVATLCQNLNFQDLSAAFWEKLLGIQEDREAQIALAKFALSKGQITEAQTHVTALLTKNVKDKDGLLLTGILDMQRHAYQEASTAFETCLQSGGDERKAHMGLGMASMGLGNARRGWEAFASVLARFPDDIEAIHWLIRAGTALSDWVLLADHLSRFLTRNPAACDVRFALAGVQYRCGSLEEARTNYEMLRVLNADYEGLEDLAQTLRNQNGDHRVPLPDGPKEKPQRTLFNTDTIKQYFQPPSGNTERFIGVLPSAVVEKTVAAQRYLMDYSIHGFGKGIEAVEGILPIVFQRQFNQRIQKTIDMWDRVAVVTVECDLVHAGNGIPFSSLKPNSLEDIDPEFAQNEGESRKKDVHAYLDKLKTGDQIGRPLYISGSILRYLGANADEKAMYMLDGARRLSANALVHRKNVEILLLIFEEEFAELLERSVKQQVRDKIQQMQWFNNYHSIPILGIQGQRSLKRFDFIDQSHLKDSVILDFGCNLGQASIKAIQAGAKAVWGIDGMEDTIDIARQIKDIAGCEHLHYLLVDFNAQDFDRVIDQQIPEKCDYSFFFSVYRTKELTQRDRLFQYILNKTKKGVFFEGHAHPQIDTLEFYDWLFDSFHVKYTFLGYSEQQIRPLFYLHLEEGIGHQHEWIPHSTVEVRPSNSNSSWAQQSNLVKSH